MRYGFIAVLMVFSSFIHAQELDKILQKHFDGYGQEFWDQINSVVVTGEWLNEEFEKYPFKVTYKRPEKIRFEGEWSNRSFVEASNGSLAWMIAPWTGSSDIQYMEPVESIILGNLFFPGSPIKPYKDKLTLEGLELYEGELMIRLKYEDEAVVRNYYLNKENHRLLWEVIEDKLSKKELIVRKQYEKYRDYHGLSSPTSVRIYASTGSRELVFKDMALGVGAPDRLFEVPKGQ